MARADDMRPEYIRSAADFERVVKFGVTRESDVLEFKRRHNERKPYAAEEIRKDVLALANTWGGVLLVGVREGGAGDGVAVDAEHIDSDDYEKWITNALGAKVFPRPTIEPFPIDVPDVSKKLVRVLAVNVRPFANGIGCYDDGDGALRFPQRHNGSVRAMPPMEVFTMMSANPARRIEIALNELVKPGINIHLTSPVLRERVEAASAAKLRVANAGSPYAHAGIPHDPTPALRVSEYLVRSARIQYNRHTSRDLTMTIYSDEGNAGITVPLGLVRDVWQFDASHLGVVLDCEIIIAGDENRSVFVRTR